MRTLFALLFVAALATPADAHPWRGKNIGLGLVLGGPTGLTVDIRPNTWSSFEIDLGFETFDNDLYAHLCYILKPFHLMHEPKIAIPIFLGIGAFVHDHGREFENDDFHLGARFPIGIAFEFRPPIQLFLEIAVMVYILHDDDHGHDHGVHLNFDGGFRIYF